MRDLKEIGWEMRQHPVHSTDLLHRDFCLLRLLKVAMEDHRFKNDTDVQQYNHHFLRTTSKLVQFDTGSSLGDRRNTWKCNEVL